MGSWVQATQQSFRTSTDKEEGPSRTKEENDIDHGNDDLRDSSIDNIQKRLKEKKDNICFKNDFR